MRKDSKRATNLFSPLQVHLVNRSLFSLTLSISSFIHWVLVLHFKKVFHWPFPIMYVKPTIASPIHISFEIYSNKLRLVVTEIRSLMANFQRDWDVFYHSVTRCGKVATLPNYDKKPAPPPPAWMTPFTTSRTHFKATCKGAAWKLVS